jgi:hypothetical protein
VRYAVAQEVKEDIEDVSVFALIGLWHREPDEMVCYRQFRVDNPYFISYKGNCPLDELLFHTEDRKNLFFISNHPKESKDSQDQGTAEYEQTLTVLDLEKCCSD